MCVCVCVCEKKKCLGGAVKKIPFFRKKRFLFAFVCFFFFPSKSNRRGEQTLECFVSSFPNEDDDDESSDEYF